MRIAVWHNLPSGGGKRALYYHVKGLIQRGHYVESWCPATADPTYLPLGDLVTEHVLPLSGSGAHVGRSRLGFRYLAPIEKMSTRLAEMDAHCRQSARDAESKDFDVIFANSCQFFRVPPIGRHTVIPKVLYLQEPYRRLYEALPQLPWIAFPPPRQFWWSPRYLRPFLLDMVNVQALRLQAREELRNAKAYDSILVNSFFSRESVLRAYGLESKVCYLGVDTHLFVSRHQPRQGFVLGVGSVTPEKNMDFVIRALGKVHHPRPSLVWVGNMVNGSYLDNMQRLASDCNVKLDVRISVDDDELVRLYNTSYAVLYAPRLEPFGFVPLEAAACGTPVLAVAEGGVRETVVDGVTGRLVEADPKAMACAVEQLLADPSQACQLGQAGEQWVQERWSLAAAIERLEVALQQAVLRSSRRGMADQGIRVVNG